MLVEFFNDGRLAMLEPIHIVPFDEGMHCHSDASTRHADAIKLAVISAMEWVMVCGTPSVPSPIEHLPVKRREYERAVRRKKLNETCQRLKLEIEKSKDALSGVKAELQALQVELLTQRILL